MAKHIVVIPGDGIGEESRQVPSKSYRKSMKSATSA